MLNGSILMESLWCSQTEYIDRLITQVEIKNIILNKQQL
jgi:hypothetical protein